MLQKKFIGKECIECKAILPFTPQKPYPFYYSTAEAPAESVNEIKAFYTEFNSDVDTIFLDVQRTGDSGYEYKNVLFNETKIQINKSIEPWAYVLRK